MLNIKLKACFAIPIFVLVSNSAFADFKSLPNVARNTNNLQITWENKNPITIYKSERPDAILTNDMIVSKNDKSGVFMTIGDANTRQYFILVDDKDKQVLKTAERVLPLATGSNFRDIGGYATSSGRHVKWGKIYRSGGSALLDETDQAKVAKLNLKQMYDLRSTEERVLAPTKIDNVNYATYNYSFTSMIKANDGSPPKNGVQLYRNFPYKFAPQLREIFNELLEKDVPLAYNCSAGQDRTGFVTAMILSSFGVGKDDIITDYHLSTKYRQPQFEMPKINLEANKDNAAAQLFAKYQSAPNAGVPQPLKDENGQAFLEGAFSEINEKWGSVDNYLNKEIKLSPQDIKKLREMYTE